LKNKLTLFTSDPTYINSINLDKEIYYYSILAIKTQCSDFFWVDVYNYLKDNLKLVLFYKIVSLLLEDNFIKINSWMRFESLMDYYLMNANYYVILIVS